MPELNQVSDLLLEWEEARCEGKELDPAEMCEGWPEGLSELRRRIELLRKFEAYFCADAATDTEPPSPVPTALPGYSIRGELGRGGMGVVYRAWQEDLDREVAIKMLKRGADFQPQVAHRFVTEARLLARLKHENIVPVYEAKLFLGQPYFVMELIQGGSVAQSAARFADDPVATATLMEAVARAVHYAHEQGVLHRDLKPANILLDEKGRPRITDFGIAKLLRDTSEATVDYHEGQSAPGDITRSADGTILGTPPYMAPEQFPGHSSAVSPRTDVWALGVILYQLLTGSRPFAASGMLEYKETVCRAEPEPPRSRSPGIDRGLEAIILRCLQKDPLSRYKTAAGLADDLQHWRQGNPLQVYKAPWVQRAYRRVKQQPLVAAMCTTLVVFGAIWFGASAISDYFHDPDRRVAQIEKILERNEKATLIGAVGDPAWFSVRPSGKPPATYLSLDGNFTVSSSDRSLVELLRNPQLDRYIMTAQVQHITSDHLASLVGIYVCRFQYPSNVARIDLFDSLSFNDKVDEMDKFKLHLLANPKRPPPPPPLGNPVYFTSTLCAVSSPKVIAWDNFFNSSGQLFKPAGKFASPWRTLTIKVTPTVVEAYWEGNRVVGEISDAHQIKKAEEALVNRGLRPAQAPPLKEMFLSYPQRGGLGLFLDRSTASFRNVTVEPLVE